jgi:hypothetical protein
VATALERGQINLQEATLLARLTHERLQSDARGARTIRQQVLKAHLEARGSQNQSRVRVREMLGESALITNETLAAGVRKADALLTVALEDVRHIFFETMKELFYALRSFNPDDLDEADIDEFMAAADLLSNTIHSIERRVWERRMREAARVARRTTDRLGVKPREAAKIREEVITGHVHSAGSQTALRKKVREARGELTLVSSEKMTAAVERVDDLLRVDASDRRHLFYEQMKDLFFALRDIRPEEIDEAMIELMTRRADELMEVVHAVRSRRRKPKESLSLTFHI